MRRRTFLVITLSLWLCLSLAFGAAAQTSSPQAMLLDQLKGLSTPYPGEFYDKSTSKGQLKITRFSGSLAEMTGLKLQGAVIDLDSKLNASEKKMAIDMQVNLQGHTYPVRAYLDGDKVILDKSFLELLRHMLPPEAGPSEEELQLLPTYLYVQGPELGDIWKNISYYREQQMPPELKELLRFFLEAIPSKYFRVTPTQFTLELDQAGWEETLGNLVEKVKNEKERFAELVANFVSSSGATVSLGPAPNSMFTRAVMPSDLDPKKMREQLKRDIVQKIDEAVKAGDYPTRADAHELAQNFRLQEFCYRASLLPGGTKELKAAWTFVDEGKTLGGLEINSSCVGTRGDSRSNTALKLHLLLPEGLRISGELASYTLIQGQQANSHVTITARAVDEKTGKVQLDLELVGDSIDRVDPNVKVETPQLTPENSVNLETIAPTPPPAPVTPVSPANVILKLNGQLFFTEPPAFIDQNNRTMVPARALMEALGCQVDWNPVNREVTVTKGDKVIKMYIDQSAYSVNGVTKKMDTAPIIVGDRTFVPLRFVAQEMVGVRLEVSQERGLTVVNILTS
ncbi:copper amine oxidase N-terminal domain-containing protein [Ammonifex thiophilus]|uniref:Copper amine oxidase N-terminal domain-containing protein n=1 Tax=Ammonifex thiophilus TaxID=444093 RepID=A0A3D8P4T2_9THEO|nr:copper amine oxidase N-terminal domain-containing protein [Ammonifex thiophilus]RDV84214.1 copper amine oxidase N-terminal domain-containing protein [Ammonifex thiophilus]